MKFIQARFRTNKRISKTTPQSEKNNSSGVYSASIRVLLFSPLLVIGISTVMLLFTLTDSLNIVETETTSQTGIVFKRLLNGKTLTFEPLPGSPGTLKDIETGSRWEAFIGSAISGPFRGKKLQELTVTPAFEFGRQDYYNDAEVYTP